MEVLTVDGLLFHDFNLDGTERKPEHFSDFADLLGFAFGGCIGVHKPARVAYAMMAVRLPLFGIHEIAFRRL